jgi:hypothetical protein
MYLFVHIVGTIQVSLGELEDAVEESLRAAGEVTGSGTGDSGSNIDIEFDEALVSAGNALDLVLDVLRSHGIDNGVSVRVGRSEPEDDGTR